MPDAPPYTKLNMTIRNLKLTGLKLIEPVIHRDARGFFLESYSRRAFHQAGITTEFVQDNHSRSSIGTIRGLHYQLMPGQTKLVRCTRGAIYDVVVDIRQGSPTFGQWEGIHLDDERMWQLYVPVGFAHGFSVLTDVAEVEYKVDTFYTPELERNILYNDPAICIDWQLPEGIAPIISPRDEKAPTLAHAEYNFQFEQV